MGCITRKAQSLNKNLNRIKVDDIQKLDEQGRVRISQYLNNNLQRIKVEDIWMVDERGRVRIFHGFNAVNKEFPWYVKELLNDTQLQLYKDWGFTAVRLGSMWTGAQPTEEGFNHTYINILKDIVTKLNKYGMYALLDMHQDVISSALGSYDGVPLWLIKKFPPSPHKYPWPLPNVEQWAEGYLTEAVGIAFQDLYKNTSSAMNYFAGFWSEIAKSFKGFSNVLGYELINEPWAGDIYLDPLLLLPGNAGKKNLAPVYDILNKAIRVQDTETLVFYEPVTWGVLLNGEVLGSGFDRVPGGGQYRNRSVLAYHYYCWILNIDDEYHPYPIIDKVICDHGLGPDIFETVAKDIAKTGGSSFLTEFGLCSPDWNPNSTATIECNFVMATADKHLQSWAYWDGGFFDDHGHVQIHIAKAFSRPYARATAGIPLEMSFNPSTARFDFKYTVKSSINANTEIYVPPLHYPRGFSVSISPGVIWHFNDAEHILTIANSQTVTITIIEITIIPK